MAFEGVVGAYAKNLKSISQIAITERIVEINAGGFC